MNVLKWPEIGLKSPKFVQSLFTGTSESSLPESPDDHFTHMKYHNFVYGGGQFWGTQNIYPVSPQYPLLNQYWPNTQQSQQQKVTFR